jgi:hypothetical protein
MNNSITLEITAAIVSFVAPSIYVAYHIIRFNRSRLKPKSN